VEVIRLAELRGEPLSVDELRAAVSDPGAGGIALFAGAVRDSDHGRQVTRLSYSAHPSCRALIDRLKHEVPIWKRQWFGDGSSEWVGSA
jgi:molybdopterin synthase catalytic subunit